MTRRTYTTLPPVVVCNDCGAYADSEKSVVHFESCQPGESARWAEYYSQPEEPGMSDEEYEKYLKENHD